MENEYDAMRNMEARMTAIERNVAHVSTDVFHLKAAMEANTAALNEYIELAKGFKYGLRFLGNIEKIAVWVAKVAAAIGILWGIWIYLIQEALKRGK